jgi:predicted ATPase
VDKSVISRQDGTFGRHAWYRMLETVREYAGAKLAADDERDVRARQVEHYLGLARGYRTEGFGPRQLEWVGRARWGVDAPPRIVASPLIQLPRRS